jgi:hypothetical protein
MEYIPIMPMERFMERGKPNMISVTFQRLGNVAMTNGIISVQIDAESAIKTQVQLQSYNDAFSLTK